MSRHPRLVLFGIAVVLAMLLSYKAHADMFCVTPGPYGEAMYCTDSVDAIPLRVLDRAVPMNMGGLETYRKYTHVTVQPLFPQLGCTPRYLPSRRARKYLGAVEVVTPLGAPKQVFLRFRVRNRDLARVGLTRRCWLR